MNLLGNIMRLKKIKEMETPEGCRQMQITEFFKSSVLPINRKLFTDASAVNMTKRNVDTNNSDDDFDDSTLPFPIFSANKNTDRVEKSRTNESLMNRQISNKPPETTTLIQLNKPSSSNTPRRGASAVSASSHLEKNSNQKSDSTLEAEQTSVNITDSSKATSNTRNVVPCTSTTPSRRKQMSPKKSYEAFCDDNSQKTTEEQTPSKKSKVNVITEDRNISINLNIDLSGMTVQSTSHSPNESYNPINPPSPTVNEKSTPKRLKFTPKESPTELKKVQSPTLLKKDLFPSPNKNMKPEDEEKKVNFKQMELLRKLFKETLDDSDKKKLLKANDIDVIEGFLQMDENHQYFLMKLFTYQHSWYNMGKFCSMTKLDQKLSAKDITTMYEYHKNDIYVYTDLTNLTTDELLNMLLLKELKQIMRDLKLRIQQGSKVEIIRYLQQNSKTQTTLTLRKSSSDVLRDAALKHLGHCIKMKEDVRSSFYKTYILQTYGNSTYYKDIQNYFKDFGYMKVVFPNYDVENFTPFRTEEQFSRFFEAVLMEIELGLAFDNKDMLTVKSFCDQAFEKLKNIDDNGKWIRYLPGYLHKFSAEYHYIGVLRSSMEKLTMYHEDVKEWLEFLIKNYPTNRAIGWWYKQLAHITIMQYKDYALGAEIAIEALEFHKKEKCFDFLQLYEMNKLANKIRNTKSYKVCKLYCEKLVALTESPVDTEHFPKIFIKGCTYRNQTPGKRLYSYTDANNEVIYGNVETIALKYYKDNGDYNGIHCEGQFIVLVFMLLFWDIVYEYYVPMTFISKLQVAPLDMFSDAFYQNRKDEIDLRLKEIASEWPAERLDRILRDNWNNHSHEKSIVDFEKLKKNVDEILEMFHCIDRKVLSKILGRLSSNYRRFRSGLPDLFLWNTTESKCKLVEVKGEGDTLQANQILWIKYLIEAGADVEVCHVSGVGAKKILKFERGRDSKKHNEEDDEDSSSP